MNARAKLAAGVRAVTALGAVGAVALAQGGGDFNGRLTGLRRCRAPCTGELVRAIRAGATYANVHTEKYPGGEIRAQLRRRASSR